MYGAKVRAWMLGVSLTALLACGPGGSDETLVVNLQSDLVPHYEYDRIELTLLPTDEKGFAERLFAEPADGAALEPVQIASLSELPADSYRLAISLLDAQGQSLTDRVVLLELEQSRAVSLRISRSCLNVACPDDLACFAGQCVDPRCSVENPSFCGDVLACSEDADCQPQAGCASGRCDAGMCWQHSFGNEPGRCNAETSWCHPEKGCIAFEQIAPPTCDDGLQNGTETAVDCGGACPRCEGDLSEVVDAQCVNGEQDDGESGIDCGGACVPCQAQFDCESQSRIPVHECLALVEVFEALGGAGWPNRAGWLSEEDPCLWEHLSCSNGHVTGISMGSNAQQGTLPAALANLRKLETLSLGAGSIEGTVPPELGLLAQLQELVLSGNRLSGTLPPELGALSRLESLQLATNSIEGTIPPSFGNLSQLRRLTLSRNALEGTLPRELGQLSRLRTLDLQENQLTGTLPPELGQLVGLTTLSLSTNRLEGSLPPELGDMTALASLGLARNYIEGVLPSRLADLEWLSTLSLGYNRLSGTIPSRLFNVPQLTRVNLESNEISGSLPTNIGNAGLLSHLLLDNNRLTGTIPSSLGTIWRLTEFRANANALSGTIPSFTGSGWLTHLTLRDNQLTGSIPPSLEDTLSLSVLDLGNNQLTGTIPAHLNQPREFGLTFVRTFLDGNRLRGEISESLMNARVTAFTVRGNSCLWTMECVSLAPWIEGFDPGWSTSNTETSCDPPPGACQ